MTLFFGNITKDFIAFGTALDEVNRGNLEPSALEPFADSFKRSAARNATWLTLVGVGIFVTTFVYSYTWWYTSEVSAKRLRRRYLQSVLRQDIAYFDKVGAGEVATRIQTDTREYTISRIRWQANCNELALKLWFYADLVQLGISEKVPTAMTYLAACIAGFALAYARSWRLALALTSIVPVVTIAGGVMSFFSTKYMECVIGDSPSHTVGFIDHFRRATLKHVADGGTIAEEVISTVRTAKAFGVQNVLSNLYEGHVAKALKAELKTAITVGISLGVFFFAAYASYALAFSFGTTLILQGHGSYNSREVNKGLRFDARFHPQLTSALS
jgi:ATP-binding cassette subfamily B (MDR/TAP) protein 1